MALTVAVVGPTASGKSDLAVRLAGAMGGEVVSVDSMQVYRGMDIGTAKVSAEQRSGVPHHLLDRLDIGDTASVADFQRWAREAIADIGRRGLVAVIAGGSALYVRAVLDEFDFPGTDPVLRARLEAELADVGPAVLHRRLSDVDPAAAAAILPSNGRRVVRALEVVELTGRPFRAERPPYTYALPDVVQIGLDVPRDVLDVRIEQRVRRMWEAGFVDEVRRLAANGLADGRTASRALGYRQVLAHLAGECTEEEAFDATVRATRRFARRQDSWFRIDPRIRWLPCDAADLLERAVALARWDSRS